jgi:hypothetical protein
MTGPRPSTDPPKARLRIAQAAAFVIANAGFAVVSAIFIARDMRDGRLSWRQLVEEDILGHPFR